MISTFRYVDNAFLSAILHTVQLMPQRQSTDVSRYGIDLAWQYETICVWYRMMGGTPSSRTFSVIPRASDVNAVRTVAGSVKSFALESAFCAAAVPTSSAFTSSNIATVLQADRIAFGNPPGNVSAGMVVDNDHFSSMYTWMQSCKWIVRYNSGSPSLSGTTYRTDTQTDGGDLAVAPAGPSNGDTHLLYVDWSFRATSNDYSQPNRWGGGYVYAEAVTSSPLTLTLNNVRAEWVKSVIFYVSVIVRDTVQYINGLHLARVLVPMQATFTASGANTVCTVSNVHSCVSAVLAACGITPLPFKDSAVMGSSNEGSYNFYVDYRSIDYVALELANDYVVPTAA